MRWFVSAAGNLLDLFQMRQRGFGVGSCDVGMALFALVNCLFEMFDRFFGVRVGRRLLRGRRMGQRQLGMSSKDIGVSHLAMVNGLLCVRDGTRDMIFSSERNLRH